MRALVVSDLHGNVDALDALEAWRARQPAFDVVWVVGDLVDYGAAPGDVIAWSRRHAAVAVRGNHDHAMATGESCRSSAIFLGLSVSTREYLRPRLAAADIAYLDAMPLADGVALADGRRVAFAHAVPTDPLFGYVATGASDREWADAIAPAGGAAFLFVGHTHDQFVRAAGPTTIVNPGSVGLPTDGDPRAGFAVFENGVIRLHRIPYDVDRAVARVQRMAIDVEHRTRLEILLRTGRVPPIAAGT